MISQSKYVDITSGVGGEASVSGRQLILRLFTSATQMPTGKVLEFADADNVGKYFGFSSKEYKLAVKYFGYVSSYQTKPSRISFYCDERSGKAPFLFATKAPATITELKGISDGSFRLVLGDKEADITGISFASANSYNDVASAIQSAIRGAGDTEVWTNASVVFNAEFKAFVITGGNAEEADIKPLAVAESGTFIGGLLKLDADNLPVVSLGVNAKEIAQVLSEALNISNNYGTFAFIDELTEEEIVSASEWTHAENEVGGMFLVKVFESDALVLQDKVKDYDGVALTLDNGTDAWLVPAVVCASTNYNRVNGTQNYMYKTLAGVTASVTTDADYEKYSAKKVNFYGSTQQAGTGISFYQQGMLQGSIDDMGVYANELWLKDAITVEFLNYQLAVAKWPANESGRAIGDGLIQGVINVAKNNGTILQAKDLTSTQKAFITSLTDDSDAWRNVYSEGYVLSSKVALVKDGDAEHYEYQYMLIYSKGDSIRKVVGTHTLI